MIDTLYTVQVWLNWGITQVHNIGEVFLSGVVVLFVLALVDLLIRK